MAQNGGARPGAGKKKGTKASHTLLAAKTKEAFIIAVHDNLQDLFNSLITQAKKGNMVALKELLDRAWGKPHQGIGMEDREGNDLTRLFVEIINAKDSNNSNSR